MYNTCLVLSEQLDSCSTQCDVVWYVQHLDSCPTQCCTLCVKLAVYAASSWVILKNSITKNMGLCYDQSRFICNILFCVTNSAKQNHFNDIMLLKQVSGSLVPRARHCRRRTLLPASTGMRTDAVETPPCNAPFDYRYCSGQQMLAA